MGGAVIMPRPVAGVLCALGAFLIVAGLHMWRAGRETRSYTRTRGRVVRAEVEEIPGPAEEGGSKFRPVLRYAFDARGRAYESERVSIGAPRAPDVADVADARRLVERYPAGSEVDIWFDPRDPRRSVLEQGIPPSRIAVAVAIGIALLGIGMFVLAR